MPLASWLVGQSDINPSLIAHSVGQSVGQVADLSVNHKSTVSPSIDLAIWLDQQLVLC